MSCWIRLGIEPTQDLDAIRLAYRGRLPAHHPETDPEGFQALREAYEQALRLAREPDAAQEAQPTSQAEATHPALQRFYDLLEDPAQRFDPQAWQSYIAALDDLPLDELDQLSGQLLHTLYDCGPLSHHCAGLLARRLAWADQLLRLDNPQHAEALLDRLEQPDPFDTVLMRDWPATAQMEALWYLRSLEYCYQQRPLFEYEEFANEHTCLALPDDPALIQRLMQQFCHAGVASPSFYEQLLERQAQGEDSADLLYLLARQASALGAEQDALGYWLRLYREHQHPQAERWLIDICSRDQPLRLPLLIQAMDRQQTPANWPTDLADPAQAWGSPGQSPQTLMRWSAAARLQLDGIAGLFIDWRLDGDDELPLLAWLLQDQDDRELHQLYWHAWALQRGETGLLRLVLAHRPGEHPLDALIVEGLQRQATQQIHWLEQSPVAQALQHYCLSVTPEAPLPAGLLEDATRPLCREWLRRMRRYTAQAIYELNCNFDMQRLFTVPFAMQMQGRIAEDGIILPPMPKGEELWEWHRQQLFMLAMIEQPTRWLALIDPAVTGQLQYPDDHPFAATHARLLQHQGGGLLGSLERQDPVQAIIAARLATLEQALKSARLPSAAQLLDCLDNDDGSLSERNTLSYVLLCAVLYHDRSLDEAQHASLHQRLMAVTVPGDWFEPWRQGLLEGKIRRPPAQALRELGMEQRLVRNLLEALESLLVHCTPPKTRVLLALQRVKDEPRENPALRCAIMAVLGWAERMLANDLTEPPAKVWEFWKLKSRLNRTGFALHLLAAILSGFLLKLLPAMMAVTVILVISGALRRLRDCGQGVPSLLGVLVLSRVFPGLALVLLAVPGNKLPNCYGPVPGEATPLQGGLQATLRRLNGQ
ncbi:J domain-containing protein [Pseudomonas fakonensis]|uniref:J domain-containing protein n=1 Tax=Pseudomonas fakonensis TaxID=2842355 RepID=A0ABX8NBU8_9PSED|nr:J domain-containing protein [Pseudomonas fakonensis]QXH52812.1 J domain-containing protein [Pseudomonas fakonensis]